ncbi:MAG: hypothetical protein U9Q92_04580 [archaeon]|nr:hypothetical protein [archaeon]
MTYTQLSPLKEYYLWRNKTETVLPWKRQYLNQEFLKIEEASINRLSEWRHKFLKTSEGKALEEAYFYTVPLEISTTWKASIASTKNNYIGLSALQNNPSVFIVALLPSTIKQPREYQLINIVKSKKIYIFNKRLKIIEPAILIEDWNPLPSDKLYLDIPYEKKIVQNLFKECQINDDQISSSFQAPIMSSPYVHGSYGGITLSSIAGDNTFARELVKTIQFMVPPEYRDLKAPERVHLGSKFQYLPGLNFHFAERPYSDKNFLNGFCDTSCSGLLNELSKRSNFIGEYSIFSTLSPTYGTTNEIWKELMRYYTSTEITLPEDLDELPEMDVNLMGLKKVINEDLWIQTVHSRQITPSFTTQTNNDYIKTLRRIHNDFDAILADIYKRDIEREHLVKTMMVPTQNILKRISQSFARSNDKDTISLSDLKQSRNLLTDNFNGFVNHQRFKSIKYKLEKKKKENDISKTRISIVQTTIIHNQKLSAIEIYEIVKSSNLFRDIYDLQDLLDWLCNNKLAIVDINKKYIWIGE